VAMQKGMQLPHAAQASSVSGPGAPQNTHAQRASAASASLRRITSTLAAALAWRAGRAAHHVPERPCNFTDTHSLTCAAGMLGRADGEPRSVLPRSDSVSRRSGAKC